MLQCPTRLVSWLRHPASWMAVAAVVLLQACSTAQIDSIPTAAGGLPEGAPKRSAEPPAYPAVNDMPPTRAGLLDTDEQKRLHDDLIAARNRQPNQEKNIARDKKRAEEEARKAEKEKNSPKKKGRKTPRSEPTSIFPQR